MHGSKVLSCISVDTHLDLTSYYLPSDMWKQVLLCEQSCYFKGAKCFTFLQASFWKIIIITANKWDFHREGFALCAVRLNLQLNESNVSARLFQVDLVNIGGTDIVDGNRKLTLGLIWSIILHWQVSTHTCCSLLSSQMPYVHTQTLINVCSRSELIFQRDQKLRWRKNRIDVHKCVHACHHAYHPRVCEIDLLKYKAHIHIMIIIYFSLFFLCY